MRARRARVAGVVAGALAGLVAFSLGLGGESPANRATAVTVAGALPSEASQWAKSQVASQSRVRERSPARAAADSADPLAAFPAVAASRSWRPLSGRLGDRVVRPAGARGAVVRAADGRRGLVESSQPLWTASGAAVDLDLREDGREWFRPAAPLVEIRIARRLGDGIRIGEAVGVRIEGASGVKAQSLDGRLVWRSVLPATDAVVVPTPLGVETFHVLHSQRSPERLRLGFDLDAGTTVEPGSDGSAAVRILRGGALVARVAAPSASDAAGNAVPVRANLHGDVLELRVDHRAPGVHHPVLVDPVIEGAIVEESLTPTAGGWTFQTAKPELFSGSVGPGPLGFGQYQTSKELSLIFDQDSGWWRYQAPGQAFVYRVDLSQVSNLPAQGLGATCLTEGIFNSGDWERGGEWSQGGTVGGSGPWSTCASVAADAKTFCAMTGCAIGGQPGSSAAVKQWASGTGMRTTTGTVHVGAAAVYLSDGENPSVSADASAARWYASGTATWTLSAADAGIGVSRVVYDGPGSADGELVHGCTGLQDARCPASWSPSLQFDTTGMPEGEHPVSLTVKDAIDRSATVAAAVRVDRTAPEVGYSGGLASLDGRTVAADAGIQVDASDASDDGPRAGVRSIQFFVDGVQKDQGDQTCPAGSCAMSRSWTFAPGSYAAGEHAIRVLVSDWAGNTSERTITVRVGSGRLSSVNDGFRTTRRVPLEASAYGDQTGVRFQYRKKATDGWADIPPGTVRHADGSAVSGWPLTLDGGVSPPLVWDLVGAAGEPGMISSGALKNDGPVQIRGLFEGGVGGTTQELWLTLDRSGVSARNATAAIGPGEIDLLTGNFSYSQTDVSIAAYKADLVVSRTYNSRGGWEFSTPSATLDYTALRNLAEIPPPPPPAPPDPECEEFPEWCEYEDEAAEPEGPQPLVIVTGADGEEIEFAEEGTGYRTAAGYETLKLERIMSTSKPGKVDHFKLTDTGSGEAVIFKGTKIDYRPDEVRMTGQGNSATYVYSLRSFEVYPATNPASYSERLVLERMIAPRAAGIGCDSALVRGCRALEFSYDSSGQSSGKLTNVALTAWDAETAAMKTTTVVSYSYDSEARLWKVDDPRRWSAPEELYSYDSANRLSQISPVNKAPWYLTYEASAQDPSMRDPRGLTPATGRLRSVKRVRAYGSSEFAISTVVYDVPVTGAGAPHDLSAAAVGAWGQARPPVDATAIFRPDDLPSTPPGSYAKATVHYLDAHGRVVNTAMPGGHVNTSESDRSGNVVRELTAANRERALASGTSGAEHAAAANLLATARTFDSGGVRLLEEFGPEHDVKVADGSPVRARRHATFAYDEGAPSTGGPFNLATTETVGARVAGESADRDVRTTKRAYDWALRQQTEQITDPAGLNLRTITVYDAVTGLAVEQRMPRNPGGGDASATRTVYWTAGANEQDGDCGEHPEWAGMACKTKPVAQPATVGLPDLPISVSEYGYHGQPTRTAETVGGSSRVTSISYDAAGRIAGRETTGSEGTALGKITYEYDDGACGHAFRTRLHDGADYYDVIDDRDYLCRTYHVAAEQRVGGQSTNYTGADYTFDLLGRVATRAYRGVTQTYGYDAVRGLLSSIDDRDLGRISASYDADGQLTSEVFETPAVTTSTTYDETGTAVRRRYVKGAGCSQDCEWLDDRATESIHGQWLSHDGALSRQTYAYDVAGRLTRVQDTVPSQGCTTRAYGLDADSNRTSLSTHPPAGDGSCQTGSGQTTTHQHDAADRLIDSGYQYDAFGRISHVPGADAGGQPLEASYYVNDRVRTLTQGNHSVTTELDALLRPRVRTETNAKPEELHYGGLTDEPLWSKQGNDERRYIDGIGGDLAAITTWRSGIPTYTTRLQLTNLHGDIVGESPATAGATAPAATWETDEFGVPRTSVRPEPIKQIGEASTVALSTPGTAMTFAKPEGVQPGDLLVIAVGISPANSVTPPAGWTQVGSTWGASSGSSLYRAYWRIAGDADPASYTVTSAGAGRHRGGLVALRNTDTSNPIHNFTSTVGSTADPTITGLTPSVDNAALVHFLGSDAGDADGGGAWTFPAAFTEPWDIATGPTSTDRNQAAAIRVLVNGKNVASGSTTATNQTGLASASWGAITLLIAPRPPATEQYRYRYLGAKQRPLDLPGGAIGMGARVYLPQIGRFLQTDPIQGGSCNAYDYVCGDPVNEVDLDGQCMRGFGGVCRALARGAGRLAGRAARGLLRVALRNEHADRLRVGLNDRLVRAVDRRPRLRSALSDRPRGSLNTGYRRIGISKHKGVRSMSYRTGDRHYDLYPHR